MEARDRILMRAQELFNKFGFRRVTMDEIALKTGMSKKTIYQSFSTKDEIVDAIVEEHIHRSVTRCDADVCKAENAIHEVFLSIDMLQEQFSEMNPSIIDDLEKFFPSSFMKLYKHKNSFIGQKVRNNLEQGVKEGLYREEINIDILTKFRVETMFLPFNQDAFPYAKYHLMDVEREILEHFLYGIATAQGQKLIKKYKQQRTKIK